MTEQIKLLDCPFCGNKARIHNDGDVSVWCTVCGASISSRVVGRDIAAAWNRRAASDELGDAIVSHVNYTSELQQQLDDIRAALNGYADSDLPSLAETLVAQRRLLAESINTNDDPSVMVRRLARSILDDEPAPASGWVSVGDRLPEVELEWVIAHAKGGHIFTWFCRDNGEWFEDDGESIMSVTHWQPLPPPPGTEPAPAGDALAGEALVKAQRHELAEYIRLNSDSDDFVPKEIKRLVNRILEASDE